MQLNVENLSDALHDSVYTYIFLNYHLFGLLYIFTDSDGKLKKEIDNEDTSLDKTKYFYKTAEESKLITSLFTPVHVRLEAVFLKTWSVNAFYFELNIQVS